MQKYLDLLKQLNPEAPAEGAVPFRSPEDAALAEVDMDNLASRAPAGETAPAPQQAIAPVAAPVSKLSAPVNKPEAKPENEIGRLERLITEMNSNRKKELDDAADRQMKAEMLQGLTKNIGLIVGGAQAMNTGAKVTPAQVETTPIGDLQAIVERKYKPEYEQLMDQYKLLKSVQSKGNDDWYKLAQLQNFQDNMALKAAMFNSAQGDRRFNQDRLEKDRQDKRVTQISDKVSKSGLQALEGALDQIESRLGMPIEDALKKDVDVPGFGRGASLVPDFLVGPEGRDFRQLVQNLQNVQISKQYGASQTTGEVNRFNKESGAGKLESDRTLLQGLANLKRKYNEDMKTIHAGYEKPIIEEFEKSGGSKLFVVPSKEPDADPRVDNFMKKNGIKDRNEALSILKKAGKL